MKKLLGIVVLGLLLITPSQADDIKDFQIEGMSLGDSLLDFFSENEIRENVVDVYDYIEDKTFILTSFIDTALGGKYSLNKYEIIQVEFKDMFPTSLSALDFDSTTADPTYHQASVSFKYTEYTIKSLIND